MLLFPGSLMLPIYCLFFNRRGFRCQVGCIPQLTFLLAVESHDFLRIVMKFSLWLVSCSSFKWFVLLAEANLWLKSA